MQKISQLLMLPLGFVLLMSASAGAQSKAVPQEGAKNIAGIYPQLCMYNEEGECGTGAVVPWGNQLYVITYGPHCPQGSSDKLYQITPDLQQIIRAESVGGTPANRMIHRESEQLSIGPYLIKKDASLRTLSPKQMPGRLTGTARHLEEPQSKIYIATMEEGLYSVDVHTLEVTEHIKDGNLKQPVQQGLSSTLPGYHGKGLYSAQGKLVYANNGEHGSLALARPDIPSGALASWQGKGDWQLVRRNQFTEVTGPGGIEGNQKESDPLWAMGWDNRSLLLMLLDGVKWHTYRLPKGSHSYDGAHGWNTEWPRIRDIEESSLLATMHGTFYQFPKGFCLKNSAGIRPRSNYLKVIGDFAKWQGKLVLGCDDSAQKEFLNRRPFKSEHIAPTQSNSNLWFMEPAMLDQLGPAIGRGSLWLREDVKAQRCSDPFLFDGYDYRYMVIHHESEHAVRFVIEIDREGNNQWQKLQDVSVEGSFMYSFPHDLRGAWIRVMPQQDVQNLTVHFNYRNKDGRSEENHPIFAPLASTQEAVKSQGLLRSHGKYLALKSDEDYFCLDSQLEWAEDAQLEPLFRGAEQPVNTIQVDEASVIVTEQGVRYRLPKDDAYLQHKGRLCREVATERDLFNCHGTFYELPALNAQGFAKIRPIATHKLMIDDYASHFGMLFMTGLTDVSHERVVGSTRQKARVWAGVIDELWSLGKPRGKGGVWAHSLVPAGGISDAYLMTAYDKKSVKLCSDVDNTIRLELDIDGTGLWVPYKSFELKAGEEMRHEFPEGLSAYWVRACNEKEGTLSVMFSYE